jgi:hypothetical protein
MIYEYAVRPADGLAIDVSAKPKSAWFHKKVIHPSGVSMECSCQDTGCTRKNCRSNQAAITKASRQLRREALGLYYEANEFVFLLEPALDTWDTKELNAWLNAIGPSNRSHIKTMAIYAPQAPRCSVWLFNEGPWW